MVNLYRDLLIIFDYLYEWLLLLYSINKIQLVNGKIVR